MTTNTLQKLHLKEVEILQLLIEVCDKLKIKYFAVYGTALGAVRHNGFIPWDDDIDVAMIRKDFDRFISEAPKLLPKQYFLQYGTTDSAYSILHAKLRDSNTTFLEPGWESNAGNQGIFIDIFPWDYYPTKGWQALIFKLKRKYYQNIIATDSTINYWKKKGFKNKLRAILRPIIHHLYPNKSQAIKNYDKFCQKLKPQPHVGSLESKTNYYSVEWIKEVKELTFENIKINVPIGVHEHLTVCYGDYMKLPPKEQQVPLHFEGIVDTERPYTYYTEKPLN